MREKNWIRKSNIVLFTIFLLFALAFLLGKPGQTVQAADSATSGMIGDISWEYDKVGRALTFDNTSLNDAKIPDFDSLEARPWNAFKDDIKYIYFWIQSGDITSIGERAFEGMSKLEEVHIYTNVAEIHSRAFTDCDKLYNVQVPYSAKGHVAKDAFDGKASVTYVCMHPADKMVPKEVVAQPATLNEWGSYDTDWYCGICGQFCETYTGYIVSPPEKICLSKTNYTYTGKAVTPSVTIKDKFNHTLKKDVDYTLSYGSGRKNVGIYTVTVKGKYKYKYTKNLNFTISPKGTEISKLSAGKKSFTAAVKKQATQTTGYEISYSTDKNFKKNVTKSAKITKSKTVSKKISSLKKGKTYYVKVRTYKTLKGKNYYSAWSKVKTVKVK